MCVMHSQRGLVADTCQYAAPWDVWRIDTNSFHLYITGPPLHLTYTPVAQAAGAIGTSENDFKQPHSVCIVLVQAVSLDAISMTEIQCKHPRSVCIMLVQAVDFDAIAMS